MGKIFFVFLLLASGLCWAKPSTSIRDSNDLTARSWLIADADNKIIGSKDTGTVRPIASITKIFTVLTVMESTQDLNRQVRYGNKLFLPIKTLIEMSMVRSDNLASEVLCRSYEGGYKKCIEDMNANAKKWGLNNTRLVDASGLSPENVSTAEDLLKLLNIAEQNYLIVDTSSKTKVEIRVEKKWLIFKQTNPLVGHKHEFVVSKTGTTSAAGGCIILTVKTEKGLRRVVVLGSQNGRTRIPEAEFIFSNVN